LLRTGIKVEVSAAEESMPAIQHQRVEDDDGLALAMLLNVLLEVG
jgi:hypothetical protein